MVYLLIQYASFSLFQKQSLIFIQTHVRASNHYKIANWCKRFKDSALHLKFPATATNVFTKLYPWTGAEKLSGDIRLSNFIGLEWKFNKKLDSPLPLLLLLVFSNA